MLFSAFLRGGLPGQAGRQAGRGAVQSSTAVEKTAGNDCTTPLRSRSVAQDAGEGRRREGRPEVLKRRSPPTRRKAAKPAKQKPSRAGEDDAEAEKKRRRRRGDRRGEVHAEKPLRRPGGGHRAGRAEQEAAELSRTGGEPAGDPKPAQRGGDPSRADKKLWKSEGSTGGAVQGEVLARRRRARRSRAGKKAAAQKHSL